jgi:hypothetical protein
VQEDRPGYKIEAEIGQLDVVTHQAERRSRTIFNTRGDILPKTGPKEAFRTAHYNALLLWLASYMPYRQVEEFLNKQRWQDDEDTVKSRTLADAVVREGTEIIDHIDAQARLILTQNHFDPDSGQPDTDHALAVERPEIPSIPAAEVAEAVAAYNAGREIERQIDEHQIYELFENPSECVNVSVDDVGVTEQKATGRSKNPPPKDSKHYVKNTVIHIQQGVGKYILAGLGIRQTLILLTAFLLHNDLANRMIVVFADGADDIKNAVRDLYGWAPYRIILDWFHLAKKCKERLSMGMKGRAIRNDVLKQLLSLLWLGKVDAAIEYLKHLDASKVRNAKEIEKLIAYFERNRSHIPCYALRKKLGLRISSNQGEKANDLVVAQRQKHNGMSWSKPGSSGLANVRALFLNKEDENWITRRELNFKLIPSPTLKKKCA